ncbi:N-acetyltransferase [Streptomyces sp. NPDC093228]|uniref:GCN5 family acetyltransferase n=1 Tax=unclassified Streptomyces TaxID=2593676 RepID=UPI0007411268|nr:GCN5 family acetyltransferase [Streptomyces sp. NRRL F-5122]KUJ55799.1 GCN5 family acetyltransferase [Streptomyces sp. NRRL F-5122]
MSTVVPIELAEQTEIRAYVDFVTGAPAPVWEALGIGSLRVGTALALAIREDPSRFFNKAGGFGADGPITEDVVAQVCEFYREQGVPQGAFMVAPPLLSQDWASIAAKRNLIEGGRLAKLGCEVDALVGSADGIAALDPDLRVGPVERHHALEWATVMMTTFGFTAPFMIEMAAACVGRPNWRQYAVWEGERIIAIGSIFVNGDCADMFGGATLPQGRGRGAQSALLAARARAAQDAGCRWLVAETGAEAPGEHNTSLHNMLRAGFQPLYERVTWLWRA